MKKGLVVTKNIAFSNIFKNLKVETEVDFKIDNYDFVISDIEDINNIIEFRKNYKDKLFYYNSNLTLNQINTLKHMDIYIIPQKSSDEIILNFVKITLEESIKKTNNIICFYGAEKKVGTTQIATSVAKELSDSTNEKILIFYADKKMNNTYVNQNSKLSIEDLKIEINNLDVNKESLERIINKDENLYILNGIKNFKNRDSFKEEGVYHLLEKLMSKFDLVIVDCGESDITSVFNYCSLKLSDNNYLICDQSPFTIDNHKNFENIYFKPLGIDNFSLIINKYINSKEYNDYKILGEKYKMMVSSIFNFSEIGLVAEYKKELLSLLDKEFLFEIKNLSNLISSLMNLEKKEDEKKLKFWEKILKWK